MQYALRREIQSEHQDHYFVYPEGLVLVPVEFPNWDDPNYLQLESMVDGVCDLFAVKDLRPATDDDVKAAKRVMIYQPSWFQPVF